MASCAVCSLGSRHGVHSTDRRLDDTCPPSMGQPAEEEQSPSQKTAGAPNVSARPNQNACQLL